MINLGICEQAILYHSTDIICEAADGVNQCICENSNWQVNEEITVITDLAEWYVLIMDFEGDIAVVNPPWSQTLVVMVVDDLLWDGEKNLKSLSRLGEGEGEVEGGAAPEDRGRETNHI